MTEAAEEMRFEQAAEYRDLIDSVRRIGERQKITNSNGEDKDVIALAMDKEGCGGAGLFIRNGKLIGREHYYLRIGEEEQKKRGAAHVYETVLFRHAVHPAGNHDFRGDCRAGADGRVFKQQTGPEGPSACRKKGSKEKWWNWQSGNAQIVLDQDRERIKREEGRTVGAVKEIARWLNLPSIDRIEAYDISNISGFSRSAR